jgi:Cu-Zn family superoxide dismutase
MRHRGATAAALALLVAGCAGLDRGGGSPGATAELRDATGQPVGTALLTQHGASVRLTVQASGLTPGRHGVHVHAVGRCDPPEFTSAGGHFNPLGRRHGLATSDGPHAGDLPNLVADQAGRTRYEATTDQLSLGPGPTSLFDADGSALVIHAQEDDQRTDPTGNSGARVACGVIVRR